jgi:O-antigen ligase
MILGLLAAVVAFLPLLVPRGPASTAPVDVLGVLFLLGWLAVLAVGRRPRRLPAFATLLLVALAGALAAVFSAHPSTALLTLTIEAYLALLFWAACYVLAGDPRRLRMVAAVWVVSALGWAALLIGTRYSLLPGALDRLLVSASSSGRASGASRNPNLAASYLVTSAFVLLASPWPRRTWVRCAAVGWLVLAVAISGSNGAILGGLAGAAVLGAATVWRRTSGRDRLALAGGLVVATAGLGAVLVTHPPTLGTVDQLAQSQRQGALTDSVGRLDKSVSSRTELWGRAWDGGAGRALLGVGPGEAETIDVGGEPLGKSLHNDYLAFLLERGVVGLLALAVLGAVVLRWCTTLLFDARAGWAALGAGVLANLVIALTHESYHFRHVWLLLALVWAAQDAARRGRTAEVADVRP